MKKLVLSAAVMVSGCAPDRIPERSAVGEVASPLGATLEVGPGKTYTKVCDAVAAAKAGDTIEIAAGKYSGEACNVGQAGLTMRGVGGRPILDATGFTIPNGKAILVVSGDGVVIEDMEFMGAAVPESNGGGIRIESPNLTIRRCYFHDNQDGISGGPAGAKVIVEYSEFSRNGLGAGCAQAGCSHNMYIDAIDEFTLRYSYSHRLADDPANTGRGHLVKSRAKKNFILYNRITGEDGPESYDINFPLGGLVVLVGNSIQKSATTGNPGSMVFWAEEQLAAGYDNRVFAVNNTFVDTHTGSTALRLGGTGGSLTAHNNIFVGVGTPASTGVLSSADNLSGVDPLFVGQAAYNYRLQPGSPAVDKGVAPGMADTLALVPTFEYVDPTMSVVRKDDGKLDLGAFELGTDLSGATSDGGSALPGADGGTGPAGTDGGGAGTPGVSSGGVAAGDSGAASTEGGGGGDSGCSVAAEAGATTSGAGFFAIAMAALGSLWTRRSRRRSTVGRSIQRRR